VAPHATSVSSPSTWQQDAEEADTLAEDNKGLSSWDEKFLDLDNPTLFAVITVRWEVLVRVALGRSPLFVGVCVT